MPHLLNRKDIARIRIQAEFEDIYDKNKNFIKTSTVGEDTNELETLRDELKKLCGDCCSKFEQKLTDLQSMLYSFDMPEIKEDICVIGNLKKSNSKLYQHLPIKLPYILVSTKLINKIRGLINVNIAQTIPSLRVTIPTPLLRILLLRITIPLLRKAISLL